MKKNSDTKVKVLWALLCQSASVDQQTNAVSVFNVLEELTLSTTPIDATKPPTSIETMDFPAKTQVNTKYTMVVQTEREPGVNRDAQVTMRLAITDPAGETLVSHEFPVSFGFMDKTRARAIINFENMLVTKTGRYTYTISTKSAGEKDFQEQYSTALDVKIRKQG